MKTDSNATISRKIHNPKSHAPSVYIPCWLIQVPSNLLSYAAKVLYGRLTQWSNEKGIVYRSYNQLAEEIGSTKRSVNEYLRELREVGLIDTSQPQAGGLNHFVFYDHPWMYEKINEELCYKSEPDPEQDSVPPRAGFCSTPEQDSASINIKEIKQNKIYKTIYALDVEEMLEDNPHNIPQEHIEHWIVNRGKHKVTRLVWSRINSNLWKLVEKGINAYEAFDRMVTAGWRSLEVAYFEQDIVSGSKKTAVVQWTAESVWNA